MIILVLILFYLQDIKKLKQANDSIKDNRELIDAVQETAIAMTDLAYNMQSIAFKHADAVNLLLVAVREKLNEVGSIPGVSHIPWADKLFKFGDNKHLVRTEKFSAAIVNTAESARTIIDEIRTALIKSDPFIIRKYLKEVRGLDEKAKALLAGESS